MPREHAPLNRSSAFREYSRLLVELARTMRERPDDEAAADAIRDLMDAPGAMLSPEENAFMHGLSRDLRMIEMRDVWDRTVVSRGVDFIQRAAEFVHGGQWETLLSLLRVRLPQFHRDRVAYLRSRAYGSLGCPHAAYEFMEYARKLVPSNSAYVAMKLLLSWPVVSFHRAVDAAMRTVFEPKSDWSVTLAASAVFAQYVVRTSETPTALPSAMKVIRKAIEAARSSTPRIPEVELNGCAALALLAAHSASSEDLRFARACYAEAGGVVQELDGALETRHSQPNSSGRAGALLDQLTASAFSRNVLNAA